MPLINPTPADYLDRLSILELKIQMGEAAGKDVAHFTRERACVLTKLTSSNVKLEYVVALTVVNARLWKAEDDMRNYRAINGLERLDVARVVDCAFLIQSLNDQRASLISTINAQSGEKAQEKLT